MKSRQFEIWSEGYVVSGNSSDAMLHGTQKAETFREACKIFFKNDSYYNATSNTYWACKLFDNETDARKAFG
jgi:hypothetical protein